MIQENEIPKYLKQKESNISKSNRKSKHKHHYEECLIQYRSTFIGKTHLNTGLYTYCIICAKNEILNSTTPFGGGIYSRTVKVYSFI